MRFRGWAHGAAAVALAYAFVLQLVLAGLAAERMIFAAADAHVLCTDATGSGGHDTPGAPERLSHCVICAFAAVAPVLPERAGVALPPANGAVAPRHAVPAARPRAGDRHEPRSSQGPPAA